MANPNTSSEKATSTSQSNSTSGSSSINSSMRDASSTARDMSSSARDMSSTARDTVNSVRDTARDSIRTVRDSANRMTDTMSDHMNSDEAREMMNRASETATEFYDNAQGWMRDNSRMLYMVGGFLAVGIVGYMVGRSFMNRSSEIDNY